MPASGAARADTAATSPATPKIGGDRDATVASVRPATSGASTASVANVLGTGAGTGSGQHRRSHRCLLREAGQPGAQVIAPPMAELSPLPTLARAATATSRAASTKCSTSSTADPATDGAVPRCMAKVACGYARTPCSSSRCRASTDRNRVSPASTHDGSAAGRPAAQRTVGLRYSRTVQSVSSRHAGIRSCSRCKAADRVRQSLLRATIE